MPVPENNKHLERIISLTIEGKAALFLGAGASLSSGLPTTTNLVDSIKKRFEKARFRSNDLMDCCQSVIDSDYYDGRDELEKHFRSIFLNKKPSKWHLKLPEFSWKAIFTTNFDDLIEQSYRNFDGVKDYRPVLTDSFSIVDKKTLHIFKLMGTVLSRKNDPGRMVLSNTDYLKNVKMREKVGEVLRDLIQDGTLIIIGYGGDDQFVFHLMDELIEKSGNFPSKTYMLLKSLSSIEGERQKLSDRHIIPVECTFEQFFDLLSKQPKIKLSTPKKDHTVNVFGYDLSFTDSELKGYSNFFQILTEEDLEQEVGEIDDYFKGVNQSWGPYEKGWDFKRRIYTKPDGIKSTVKKELLKHYPRQNRVLLLTGMPGIGKSILIRRLEYDFYLQGAPIIHFNNTKNKFDFKLLDSFLMEIDRKLGKISQGKLRNVKPIVTLDDVSSLMIDPVELSTYLTSRGRSALIICTARDVMFESEPPYDISKNSIIKIPQKLSREELSELIKHLHDLGYVESNEFWEQFVSEHLNGSFFAAMYMLVDPAKRPLGQIIFDQYVDFTETQKRMFLAISAFHKFNLPINIELLTRSVFKEDYEKFWETMRDGKFLQSIIEYEDAESNILYSTHNSIIAQKTFDLFLSDRIRRKEFYCDVLSDVHFAIQKERDLVERLLIRNMGPSRNRSDFDWDQLIEIYQMIVKKNPTKGFLHHLGILYYKTKDFEKAEEFLLKALKFKETQVEAYRGESNRNIFTSLGSTYLEWGKDSKKLKPVEAESLFCKAEDYLTQAMKGRYGKPHPYHVMARMLLEQGDSDQSPKKYDYYARALETISLAKGNIEKKRLRALFEIEIKIFERLQKDDMIKESINVLKDDYSSSSGYYIYAKALMLNHDEKESYQKALEVVNEGLKSFATDESLMKLRIDLNNKLYPNDLKKNFQALEQWFTISKWHDIDLIYELAVNAFILGYYPTSARVYKQLEKKSVGHHNRFKFSRFYLNENGEKKIFEGTIVRILSPYEGEIRVDSLPVLDRNIRFRTETCNFTPLENQYVTFFIGFNFVSPECVDVKKK